MNGLAFILLRSAKNSLLELRRKPAKLVLYIVVILLLTVVIVAGILSPSEHGATSDIVYLKGILFAFFLLFFYTAVKSGLSQGSTLFGMEDVNLLFVSPINPRSILIYGVFRVVKTMALASVFILFQATNLRMFGVESSGLAVLYVGYLLTAVVTQILGMFIYSATNGMKRRQQLVKILSVLMFAPLIGYFVWWIWTTGGDYMESLRQVLSSSVLSFTPILGWASAGIVAFVTGEIAMGTIYFGLLLLLGAALVAVIYVSKPDYYEDVLVASETAFEQKRNLAEGKIDNLGKNKRVRVKGTGVGGNGASAFFYKHLRESLRTNRFGLWGISTLVMTAGGVVFSLIMKNAFREDVGEGANALAMLVMLITLMWLQIFIVGTGRGLKETYSHYIYMIPESPFKKMVWSNLEVIVKAAVEGTLICLASGIAAGAGAAFIFFSATTYTLFVFMLIAVNYVSMRFTGADVSAGLLIMIYMFCVLFIMLPGIIAAVVIGVAFGMNGALAVLSIWELVVALVCFWASKGILHDCDMSVLKQVGK